MHFKLRFVVVGKRIRCCEMCDIYCSFLVLSKRNNIDFSLFAAKLFCVSVEEARLGYYDFYRENKKI